MLRVGVRVVTDSASSISDGGLSRLSIVTVPLHVHADGQLVPEAELRTPAFYERLADMKSLPTTSQPSPEEFVSAFRPLLDEGHDVLAVLISAGLSGTVRSAELAAATLRTELPHARIEIVDTKSNSPEEGFAVLAAAEARRFAAEVVEPIAGGPIPVVPISPVVGVHVGPAIGVVYETVEPMR